MFVCVSVCLCDVADFPTGSQVFFDSHSETTCVHTVIYFDKNFYWTQRSERERERKLINPCIWTLDILTSSNQQLYSTHNVVYSSVPYVHSSSTSPSHSIQNWPFVCKPQNKGSELV